MTTSRVRVQRKSFENLSWPEIEAWARMLAETTTSRWAFLSPTYARAVNAAVGPVDVLLCWQSNTLVGVMPMQRIEGWLGRLGLRGLVGREMTDYFGLLARPGVRLTWPQLLRPARITCLYFTHLDESQAACGLLGDAMTVGLCTRVPAEGAEAYWEVARSRHKKFVNDTDRCERKLASEHGPVTFSMHSSSPAPDLEFVVRFKNSQYRRTGRTHGALLNPANVELLRQLLSSDDPDCLPRLSTLRCGGHLVAAHFGLQCGNVLHYWFPTYDPAFRSYSPGRVLYRRMVFDASNHGIDCVDCGAGDSPVKRGFATDEYRLSKGLVEVGAGGRLLGLMQRAQWRFNRSRRTAHAGGVNESV